VDEPLTILVAARDEEQVIERTVRSLRQAFPDAEVIVADDGSRDRTAELAEEAGAIVLRLPRRGKGQALSAAERAAPPGRLLLCDADLEGDVKGLLGGDSDLTVAAFSERIGGGFGLAKRVARDLIEALGGISAREPLSGQRALSPAARNVCFPVAAGFGCEVRMTIDAARADLSVREVELFLRHRATRRDAPGFLHRARQLRDILYACGPLGVNFRGLRLPLVGWKVGTTHGPAVAAIAALGLADDIWSGPERGFRAHLRSRRTTGVLKLVGIPAIGLVATRRISGALLVGLAANVLNQLDTRPGRALKAYLVGALALDAPVGIAVLLLPYDLREMAMLGDAGSNALGGLLGLKSVERFTGRGRWVAIGALTGLTVIGERASIGAWIERTPGVAWIDRLGRA
jgi:Glycosyl transferase family 2